IAFEKLKFPGAGVALVAAGVALTAAASAVNAQLSKASTTLSSGGGGGASSSTSFSRERADPTVSTVEVVVTGRIEGNDILISGSRARDRNNFTRPGG